MFHKKIWGGIKAVAGFIPGVSQVVSVVDAVASGFKQGGRAAPMSSRTDLVFKGTHPGAGVPMPNLPNLIDAVTGSIRTISGYTGPSRGGGPFSGVQGGSSSTAPPARPSGFHLNKTGYFLKSGQYVAPRSRWVRNRTVNYANGRAARKAGRRLKGTVKLLRRSFKFVEARPPKGKPIVKGRR